MLSVILGLVFIAVGLGLGVANGQALGGMDGIVVGIGTIFVGVVILKDL
ncbi:MAG: hypothetical protein JRN58_08975 [Nitrososphaerota archaeon]|nr:hypothetical protein [Nitrososphaerota archaeon]MDG6966741.1 hypothetical protein [Nitrososphaerota archaeon]MDG6979198.1 hypothetical protein [Nitrososphaerota archaeon]